jgi:cell division protein FtsB
MPSPEQRISQLSDLIKRQAATLQSLEKRIAFLERENRRNKSQIDNISRTQK